MSPSIVRWFTSGLRDADARLDHALAPRPSVVADRYLASSFTVRTIDRVLQRCFAWWAGSTTYRTWIVRSGVAPIATWRQHYEFLGWTLLIAAITHLTLTLAQGARPGWYWVVIPAMTIGFAVLLLVAARSAPRS